MNAVPSKDGTKIAYDTIGHGPAVILVAGALCSRSFWSGPELAKLLAPRFTVYNYDRRGRGESGDTKPYAVEREVEDIKALIDEAGGKLQRSFASTPVRRICSLPRYRVELRAFPSRDRCHSFCSLQRVPLYAHCD